MLKKRVFTSERMGAGFLSGPRPPPASFRAVDFPDLRFFDAGTAFSEGNVTHPLRYPFPRRAVHLQRDCSELCEQQEGRACSPQGQKMPDLNSYKDKADLGRGIHPGPINYRIASCPHLSIRKRISSTELLPRQRLLRQHNPSRHIPPGDGASKGELWDHQGSSEGCSSGEEQWNMAPLPAGQPPPAHQRNMKSFNRRALECWGLRERPKHKVCHLSPLSGAKSPKDVITQTPKLIFCTWTEKKTWWCPEGKHLPPAVPPKELLTSPPLATALQAVFVFGLQTKAPETSSALKTGVLGTRNG